MVSRAVIDVRHGTLSLGAEEEVPLLTLNQGSYDINIQPPASAPKRRFSRNIRQRLRRICVDSPAMTPQPGEVLPRRRRAPAACAQLCLAFPLFSCLSPPLDHVS